MKKVFFFNPLSIVLESWVSIQYDPDEKEITMYNANWEEMWSNWYGEDEVAEDMFEQIKDLLEEQWFVWIPI